MTLTVVGKITIQNPVCEKCGTIIQQNGYAPLIKCSVCGAVYKMTTSVVTDANQNMEFTFDFLEFQCLYKNFAASCTNRCPAPEMYCKEHVADTFFKEAQSNIDYYKDRLREAETKLDKISESKKIHLTQELAGIQ